MISDVQLRQLRRVITENLRIQRGGSESVPYIDVGSVFDDVSARQNHAIFGRRGCGKTLLLHHSAKRLDPSVKAVYLNCEDFKKHSFPNVLIQILDALFAELERHLTGWFGKKRQSKAIIGDIRKELRALSKKADTRQQEVRESVAEERSGTFGAAGQLGSSLTVTGGLGETRRAEVERRYSHLDEKIKDLDMWLPALKRQVDDFFKISTTVKSVFLQVDDLYHLNRTDQPFVMDYIHRLCKDLPLYFKVATLRHASVLYADRHGQPIGAQERHDYQPINIDFTLADLRKTQNQNQKIFHEFGRLCGISAGAIDGLFRGEGFQRLVLAGGGVPRDCLSLFLEVLDDVRSSGGDGRIGKDDIRILSRSNFERRIEELKQDSEGGEQGALIRGIYVLRQFCIDKKTNVFLVSEQMMQQEDRLRELVYRLLDYRIVHSTGSAITHKSHAGTFQALVIDIGCYAHMRKLEGRFAEIDLASSEAKDKMRSAPVLDITSFESLWKDAPLNPESALFAEEAA